MKLVPVLAARRQIWQNRAAAILRARYWFPHVPLALFVALTGLAQLLKSSGAFMRLISGTGAHRSVVLNVAGGLELPAIRGVPQEAIGALLLVVGICLLWRSRLAWVLTFLLTLATVALELSPVSTASPMIVVFNALLLFSLLAFRRSFTRASLATNTLFALTGILLTLGYGVLGSYVLGAGFKPKIENVVDAVYFATVTMSTVGYGDIIPVTHEARLFSVSLIAMGLAVFATSLTAVAGPLIDSRMTKLLQPKKRPMKRNAHIIVVGDGPLARNAVGALSSRGLHVTAIWSAAPANEPNPPEDLLVGDASDTELLQSASIGQARAILALSEDDSYNAFVILAAKEMNAKVRTVAAVSSAGTTRRMERVHPDVILALPVIGSELLAMALSGEDITADEFVKQLLKLA